MKHGQPNITMREICKKSPGERHNKEVINTLQKKSIKIFKQRSVESQAPVACNSQSYSSSEVSMLMSL